MKILYIEAPCVAMHADLRVSLWSMIYCQAAGLSDDVLHESVRDVRSEYRYSAYRKQREPERVVYNIRLPQS
jgi:hypothetical protein